MAAHDLQGIREILGLLVLHAKNDQHRQVQNSITKHDTASAASRLQVLLGEE